MAVNSRKIVILAVFMISFIGSNLVVAQPRSKSDPIYQMAEIMHRLKHFPSPAGKETLQNIIENKSVSENQRILATAIFNLQHHAMDADKLKLKKIMEDKQTSADERDLASIIYNLDHRPTKEDKQRLQQMME